jgi:16S rRNA (uracil1498-N3)-methyltransferase
MTQSHALFIHDLDHKDVTQLSEEQLPSNTLRHIKALRIEKGEGLDFFNGQGSILFTRCVQNKPYLFEVLRHSVETAPAPALHLFLSAPRKDTLGQTLSQATEMGVQHISFIKSDHNDLSSKDHDKTIERSQRVLEASVEQCRAPFLPTLHSSFLSLQDLPKASPIFFADEDLSKERLLGLKNPAGSLPKLANHMDSAWILLVGPEGGWSARERELIQKHPLSFPLGLGPQILKVPTACVAALYQLQSYRHALGQQK